MALTEFRLGIATMINDQLGDEFLEDNPDLRHQIQEQIKRRLIKRIGAANNPSIEFQGDSVMTVAVLVPRNRAGAAEGRIDAIDEFEFMIAGNRVSVDVEGIDRVLEHDAPGAGPAAAGAGGPGPAAAGAGEPPRRPGGKRRKTRRSRKSRSTRRRRFY